jgi:hypothetical protein
MAKLASVLIGVATLAFAGIVVLLGNVTDEGQHVWGLGIRTASFAVAALLLLLGGVVIWLALQSERN